MNELFKCRSVEIFRILAKILFLLALVETTPISVKGKLVSIRGHAKDVKKAIRLASSRGCITRID